MSKISKNVIAALALQICNILSGLIIPRLIISIFGSNVNGLIASITQFTDYISLLEGGVASVMMANLYKPLYENDNQKLSAVFSTMVKFFRQISMVFLVYQLALAIVYPLLVHSGFDWGYVFTLTLILGINNFVQYTFSVSCKLLLEADNKIYITKGISTIVVVLNVLVTIAVLKLFPSIHIVKLLSAIVYTIQPLVYNYCLKKKYCIDRKAIPDNNTLKQRWNGFGINIAYFVHNKTDIVVLTTFTSLLLVSVYQVNMIVVNGVRTLVIAFLSGFVPTLGKRLVSKNEESLCSFFEKYELITFLVASAAFSIGVTLITPFIRIYTKGVNDVDYIQPLFACIICAAEWIYCVRDPYVQLAYQSNKFKEISKYAYAEAGINLIVSLLLVRKYGLIGVAIGTIAAMLFRAIFQVLYARKIIASRRIHFGVYFICFGSTAVLSSFIVRNFALYNTTSIKGFIMLACITCLVVTFMFFIMGMLLRRRVLISILKKVFKI